MSIPLTSKQVVDRYFLEHRAKALDIAAFLDRFDRAAEAEGVATSSTTSDVRVRALVAAVDLLRDGRPQRACRMLELWSDRSVDPIAAAHTKGAIGAVPLNEPGN
ncbi:MAG: hypothetical protein EXS01_00490 [Phycisphaerales bacterium]|nr:hypothetical protein [Phycisphaerales bacterium]